MQGPKPDRMYEDNMRLGEPGDPLSIEDIRRHREHPVYTAGADAEALMETPQVALGPKEEPRITPEAYAQLSRKARRALRKQGDAPEVVLPAAQQPVRFTDPTPARAAAPSVMYYWERRFMVAAHIFTQCPRLFKEWAGQDFRVIRTGTPRQAARHTAGMCNHCVMMWRLGAVA